MLRAEYRVTDNLLEVSFTPENQVDAGLSSMLLKLDGKNPPMTIHPADNGGFILRKSINVPSESDYFDKTALAESARPEGSDKK